MAAKDMVFTVDRADAVATAERLRAAGVTVSGVLGAIGVVNGCAEEGQLEKLRAIPGVRGVELSRDAYVGPPDAPIQ